MYDHINSLIDSGAYKMHEKSLWTCPEREIVKQRIRDMKVVSFDVHQQVNYHCGFFAAENRYHYVEKYLNWESSTYHNIIPFYDTWHIDYSQTQKQISVIKESDAILFRKFSEVYIVKKMELTEMMRKQKQEPNDVPKLV